ncbi:MAG: hypothetical protein ABIG20_03180 [archaeon]
MTRIQHEVIGGQDYLKIGDDYALVVFDHKDPQRILAELRTLHVFDEGQGHGRALVEAAVEFAEGKHAKVIWGTIAAMPQNHHAKVIRILTGLGFKVEPGGDFSKNL